jgi:hypothetical protein
MLALLEVLIPTPLSDLLRDFCGEIRAESEREYHINSEIFPLVNFEYFLRSTDEHTNG